MTYIKAYDRTTDSFMVLQGYNDSWDVIAKGLSFRVAEAVIYGLTLEGEPTPAEVLAPTVPADTIRESQAVSNPFPTSSVLKCGVVDPVSGWMCSLDAGHTKPADSRRGRHITYHEDDWHLWALS